MNVETRIRIIQTITKIERNKSFSKSIGLTNQSMLIVENKYSVQTTGKVKVMK